MAQNLNPLELTTSVDVRRLRKHWAGLPDPVPAWPVTQPEPTSVELADQYGAEVRIAVPNGLIIACVEEYESWAYWSNDGFNQSAPAGWSDNESTAALAWATALHALVMTELKDAQRELLNRHSEALVSVALSVLR